MQAILAITKALADENRLRALMMLREQEWCACQVIEVLGLAPSTVSKHMTILRRAGLVMARKEWWWMHYSLPQSGVRKPVKESIPFGVVLENQHRLYPVAYEKNGLFGSGMGQFLFLQSTNYRSKLREST